MMSTQAPVYYRKDYQSPDFCIETVSLSFDIQAQQTLLTATLQLKRLRAGVPLVLVGAAELVSVTLNDKPLSAGLDYQLENDKLTIAAVEDRATLTTVTRLLPQENTSLMGLYASGGQGEQRNLFTQCEPEGLRKMTYYLDRPDVMAVFTTRIEADAAAFPVLLSNGNKIDGGALPQGRHFALWHDPHPKPAYLFALVAGQLVCNRADYVTAEGRAVALEIWTEAQDTDKVDHAMQSLIKAMRWDETRFGLNYDLDIYMIVAVGDFNMGAMENKGLNIFNTKYVLATVDTATDTDFDGVESVIAHEYFHNWTGNRVTCQDWFQLSLKEGLTVFRDQEFSADMGSAAVCRIENVRQLRAAQFPEDAGPTAHPVRPESYSEMNNFYTMTIYEKGAEVVRMYQTLLGREGFNRGMALYFQRHDGQAVTCDDFRLAMAEANGVDLTQFGLWYSQAGTPRVTVRSQFDAANLRYTLHVTQTCPMTPDSDLPKQPFHFPLSVGLIDAAGQALALNAQGETTAVLNVTECEQSFVFEGIHAEPTPSLLRGFSAPVILDYAYSDAQLAFLMSHDEDAFCRWEAGQTLAERVLLQNVARVQQGGAVEVPADFLAAIQTVLDAPQLDDAFKTLMLTLPSVADLVEKIDAANPPLVHQVRVAVLTQLAQAVRPTVQAIYTARQALPFNPADAGPRALKNWALGLLMLATPETAAPQALAVVQSTNNMTDLWGALLALRDTDCPERTRAYADFAEKWVHNPLVMDKYFMLIASSSLPDTLSRIQQATQLPAFSLANPNKARAVYGSLGRNMAIFHDASGAAYRVLADTVIKLDALNPQTASRLVQLFNRWQKMDAPRQILMQQALESIAHAPSLSNDVREMVQKMSQ
jgi:aminopeptidase N